MVPFPLSASALLVVQACVASAQLTAISFLLSQMCPWNPAGPLDFSRTISACSTIIDDERSGPQGTWAPWSRRPTCAYPVAKNEPKYCAFSYDAFRGTHGVAFLTTPEIAVRFLEYTLDSDRIWDIWSPRMEVGNLKYEVRDIAGKGKGAIANDTIVKGEILVFDQPVVIALARPPPSIRQGYLRAVLRRAYEALPERDRWRMGQLASSTGGDELEDIIRTNVFGVVIDGQNDHHGLFPDVSRLNHECRPNCFTRFSRRSLHMEVVAVRDIAPGEELTVNYIPLNFPTAMRKDFIRNWGFTCTCPLCTNESLSTPSDANRQRIQEILAELDDAPQKGYPFDVVESLADEVLDLIEEENLEVQVGDFYITLAKVYGKMGFRGEARRWARMGVTSLEKYVGEDSEQVWEAVQVLEWIEAL